MGASHHAILHVIMTANQTDNIFLFNISEHYPSDSRNDIIKGNELPKYFITDKPELDHTEQLLEEKSRTHVCYFGDICEPIFVHAGNIHYSRKNG